MRSIMTLINEYNHINKTSKDNCRNKIFSAGIDQANMCCAI